MIISIRKKRSKKGLEKFSAIHLSRPLALSDIMPLVEVKKKFTMSQSTFDRLSKRSKEFLKDNKVRIKIITKQGRPINLSTKEILHLIELNNAGFSYRKIGKKTGLPKSTIHYLIKSATRNRIKYKGMTVFLD
jgi:hypothetical protein